MDIAEILRDILIVLVAAKLAAEVAERIGVPAVVGEILAGVVIGPSVFHLLSSGGDDVLRTLGEIGVILLLLDVGLEMDLAELGKVGRASMLVATVGVIAPMVLGIGAMELLGNDFNTSLFVGAALTATSVGITARVFGDLRALGTTEARIVLGAAVADDVMGLVVLTVVVRLVTEGSVSVLSVAGIVGVAVAFLVFGALVGLRLAPPLFGLVERVSRSTGTLVALALAFTLAFAEVANAAKLAPIVGAFVAGIALSRSEQSGRVRRELAPVGHLFIPVFFLQIGIDADFGAFTKGAVLRDASVLLLVAVLGKLVSPIGAIGSPGDKPLIGLGMLPRGEVGLIFATIGLQNGVLGDELYASLLLVVLVTTLVTPQFLKMRYSKLRRERTRAEVPADAPEPPGGWLEVADGEVRLRAEPPFERALDLALRAAILVGRFRPSTGLLEWLTSLPDRPLVWDSDDFEALLDVIERGNARSWRFLDTSGVLDRGLPELADALRERGSDPFALDPLEPYQFNAMAQLRRLDADDPLVTEIRALAHLDWLLLALLCCEAFDDRRDSERDTRRLLLRIGITPPGEEFITALVADRDLMWSAARQTNGLGESAVLQLAEHLATSERARALYALSALRANGRERWEIIRLRQLYELVQLALADPTLTGSDARTAVDVRRADAIALASATGDVEDRIIHAPRSYVLRQQPEALARHAQLLARVRGARHAEVGVEAAGEDTWWVDVAARDRPGLLAAVTGVLAAAELDVEVAVVATWDDGLAIESFRVRASTEPHAHQLVAAVVAAFGAPLTADGLPDATISFDATASPWHTVCEVRVADQPRLLHALATAFAAAGIDVQAASLAVEDDVAIDRFEVVDRNGAKLDAATTNRFRDLVETGVAAKRRRFRRALVAR